MTDLIDKYFEIRSKEASKLDFKKELRDFAVFLRKHYGGSKIKIDPVDAREVRALFLTGAVMLVDPPESKKQRGGDYLSKPYKAKKEELIGDFKTTVEKWSKKPNEQTLKGVYDSIMDVAGMVPQQVLLCTDVSIYKKVLRFFLGSVAATRNLVATALSGIFGQRAKTTVEDFASVLEDPSLPLVMQMVLEKVGDATDTMHRVCNACFLYFVTQITDFDDNLFDIRYMYPITKVSGNTELHKRVKSTSERVLNSFCIGPFSYSEDEGFVYYDVFPSFGILWHEIVSCLMARHYCCVLLANDKELNFDTKCYSVNQLLTAVDKQIKKENAENNLSFDYVFERDCVERLPNLTRRPYNEEDHVVLFALYHGVINDRVQNVTVPNNVTMVVMGTSGRVCSKYTDHTCESLLKDLHLLSNSELNNSGCEIVPGGGVYPNLDMANTDSERFFGLYGCGKKKTRLIPLESKRITLEFILQKTSDHAHKYGQMALLFMSGCQETRVGEKVSVGTDATYQAINILPKTIKVVTFDGKKIPDFNVHRVIQDSLNKRKAQRIFLQNMHYDPRHILQKEHVVPDERLAAVQRALDKKRYKEMWNTYTRVPGGSVGRSRVPFWTLVVVTVLAALAPELSIL